MARMVGERLRQARVARQLSLADVAAEAKVSAATLSRIERDKQAIDVTLFMLLARILSAAPAELLEDDDGEGGGGALAARIAGLQVGERTELWRRLGDERRESRQRKRGDGRSSAAEFEELLAHMDFLRQELEAVRSAMTRKR